MSQDMRLYLTSYIHMCYCGHVQIGNVTTDESLERYANGRGTLEMARHARSKFLDAVLLSIATKLRIHDRLVKCANGVVDGYSSAGLSVVSDTSPSQC
jgi:hypothetical protein